MDSYKVFFTVINTFATTKNLFATLTFNCNFLIGLNLPLTTMSFILLNFPVQNKEFVYTAF